MRLFPEGGERRVASAVAKRLQSLGALTHGDRRATAGGSVSSLEAYNWDTRQGRDALAHMYKSIACKIRPITEIPRIAARAGDDEAPHFFDAARGWLREVGLETEAEGGSEGHKKGKDKSLKDLGRFLNRILGLEVWQQTAVLEYFVSMYEHFTREARRDGEGDECVYDQQGRHVRCTQDCVVFRDSFSSAEARHLTFEVDRGISWEEAIALLQSQRASARAKSTRKTASNSVDGFYSMNRKGLKHVLLAMESVLAPGASNTKSRLIRVLRPATGEHANQADYILSR